MARIQYRPVNHEPSVEKRVPRCSLIAMVIIRDPQEVTCPQCQEGLRKLAAFLDALWAHDA
jgi:hypothetical protein